MASDNNHTPTYSSSETEEEEDPNPPTTPPNHYLMVPVPSSSNSAVIRYIPDTKPPPPPPPQALFQRIWNEEDEIELLNGFLKYTTRSGWLNSSHHHDTSAFYAEINPKLNLRFNKSQLVEKIRRLKKKYRTVATKLAANGRQNFQFKTPHDEATFRISHKIWSFSVNSSASPDYPDEITVAANPTNSILNDHNDYNNNNGCEIGVRKRPREAVEPIGDAIVATPVAAGSLFSVSNLIEETVKVCASPVIKEFVRRMKSAQNGISDEVARFGVTLGFEGGLGDDNGLKEKWRKQRLLELEVYSKRIELIQDEIKLTLQEL